jgi:hypothetical protein
MKDTMTTNNCAVNYAEFLELLRQRQLVDNYNKYCQQEKDRYWGLYKEKQKTINELTNPSFFKRLAQAIFGTPLPLSQITYLKRDKEEYWREIGYWEGRCCCVAYMLRNIDQNLKKFCDSDIDLFARAIYQNNEKKE